MCTPAGCGPIKDLKSALYDTHSTSCIARRKVVATVACWVAVGGFARFFRKVLRAVERYDAARGSVRFCHVAICCEEIYKVQLTHTSM